MPTQAYDLQTFTIVCLPETITLGEYDRLIVFGPEFVGRPRRSNRFGNELTVCAASFMNRNVNCRWMQLGGTLLLLLVLAGCQSAVSSKDKQALAATTRAVPVAVASAVNQDMPVYLTGLGSVTAYNTVSVKSRVDGELIQVNFREGQQVNKGDLLILIDPRPYEVQLASAQAQLFKDQASFR